MRWLIVLLITFVLLVSVSPAARAQSEQPSVEVLSTAIQGSNIELKVRVKDRYGYNVTNLTAREIQVIEDDTPIESLQLEELRTSAMTTSLEISLVNTNPLTTSKILLANRGATIGIVFDSTSLLNDSAHKYTDDGQLAIEQFLLLYPLQDKSPPRTQAPENSEAFSLYIPIAQSDQQVQPEGFTAFSQDRNSIINYLRKKELRQGKTNLYAAVKEAVIETADAARKRGSEAVVLIVSDGGDTTESGKALFNDIVPQANEQKVKIIAFGIGKALDSPDHGDRLNQFASGTGGIYEPHPAEKDVADAFNKVVAATPESVYNLRYTSQVFPDGKVHSLSVRVKLPDGPVESEKKSFELQDTPSHLPGLWQILLRRYVFIVIPMALITSFVFMLIAGAIYRFRSGSIGNIPTVH